MEIIMKYLKSFTVTLAIAFTAVAFAAIPTALGNINPVFPLYFWGTTFFGLIWFAAHQGISGGDK